MALTLQQELFVREYLKDLNATQAAIRAGYSEKTAYSQGQRLLSKNVEIIHAIEQEMEKRKRVLELDAKWVLANLREVAERCMQKVPVIEWSYADRCMKQKTDDQGRDVWEFDSKGANQSLQLIGKHIGMFKEGAAGDDETPQPVKVEITVRDARKRDAA